ncbi:hypothetical protein VTH8203_02459 [Vibrio thalassae]|uniref:Uncharacterized protein n=1 Tax=Vibrio thalassae TaxID=1243014 RepID=A0A240EJG3_9VIBR|nr:hypothetical protein [Vibrio thalassae]SNX48822.1 hypothetical protein VTH8203_02459 [Vibrio thalassae]
MDGKNSTIIHCEAEASPTLWSVIHTSSARTMEKFVRATSELCSGSPDNVTTAEAVAKHSGLSIHRVRDRIRDLIEKEIAVSFKASDHIDSVTDHRVRLVQIKKITDAPVAPVTIRTNNRTKYVEVVNYLENNNIHDLERLTGEGDILQGYQTPSPTIIKKLFAPGSSQRQFTEIETMTSFGRKTSSATGAFGVMNAQDNSVQNAIQTLSCRYVANLPDHIIHRLAQSKVNDFRIPIWTDDVHRLTKVGKPRTATREEISLSFLRISRTDFHVFNSGGLSDRLGQDQPDGVYLDFRFLESLDIPASKNSSEDDFIPNQSNVNYDEEKAYLAKAKRLYGEDFPFKCVLIRWNSEFFRKMLNASTAYALSLPQLKLPPILNILTDILRNDYYGENKIFRNRVSFKLTLFSLFTQVWPSENDDSIDDLILQFQKEVRFLRRNMPDDCTFSTNKTELQLFGITIDIDWFNLEFYREMNRNSMIEVTLDEKKLVESAKARFQNDGNNTPTLPNPLKRLRVAYKDLDLDPHPRQIKSETRDLLNRLDGVKYGKYVYTFTVQGISFRISRYIEPERLSKLYAQIAVLADCDLRQVNLHFSDIITGLEDIPRLSFEQIKSLALQCDVSTTDVVNYLSTRIRYLDRLEANNFQEVVTHFKTR